MKIYLIVSNPGIAEKMLKSGLDKIGSLTIIDGHKLSAKEVIQRAGDVEILIAGPSGIENISREMLQGLRRLKMIATLSVGVDWIDTIATREFKIIVSNTQGVNSESVAEHAWGMILDLSKRITEFDRDVRNKGSYKFPEYTGKEIYGKTLGIIGLGNIGQKIARIASAFNMKVLGLNKSHTPVSGVELVEPNQLFRESDIITVCVPLTADTKNLISDTEISLMKNGVILVNTSREQITDKNAVLHALDIGKIFGFGIETEIMKPIPPDDPYLKHPRIIVTPHNAFNTEEVEINSNAMAVENIKAFIKGQPQNVVNL